MFSLFIRTVVSPAEVLCKFKLQLYKASLLVVTGSDYNFSKLGNESFVELEHSTVAHRGHAQYYFSHKSKIPISTYNSRSRVIMQDFD